MGVRGWTFCFCIIALFYIFRTQSSCPQQLNETVVEIEETRKNEIILLESSSADITWSLMLSHSQPGSINTTILFDQYLILNDNNMTMSITLAEELDKEGLFEHIRSLQISVKCKLQGIDTPYTFTVVIKEVNEFPVKFQHQNYTVNIKENTPVDSIAYNFTDITDADRPPEILQYTLSSNPDPQTDASTILQLPYGDKAYLTVLKKIDYDVKNRPKTYYAKFCVTDGKFNHNTTIIVNIIDVDDLPPIFIPSCSGHPHCITRYSVKSTASFIGELTVIPGDIKAKDQDSLNYPLTYHIVPDGDHFSDFFSINSDTGQLYKTGEVLYTNVLHIKAIEKDGHQFEAVASVLIDINPNSSSLLSQASKDDTSDSFMITTIALAVVLVIVITVFIILALIAVKEFRKHNNRVNIETSPSTSKETLSSTDRSNKEEPTNNIINKSLEEKMILKSDPLQVQKGGHKLPPLGKPDKLDKTTEAHIKKKKKRKKKKTLLQRRTEDDDAHYETMESTRREEHIYF